MATPVQAAQPPVNVLVLFSSNRLLPALGIIDETLDAQLRAEVGGNVELFNEFLDVNAWPGKDYQDQLARFLKDKYAAIPIAAVVAANAPALRFLLERRDDILPGVPIVFIGLSTQELARMTLPRDVLGVAAELLPEKTIELALRLHPGSRRVVVITGTSQFDLGWEALLRSRLQPLAARVEVDFWAGLPMAEILGRVRDLPRDSVVYLPGLRQDGAGERFVPQLVAAEVVAASPVPVYGSSSNFREAGTAGGYIPLLEDSARAAAGLVASLLRGAAPETLPTPVIVANEYILNMKHLSRFGVAEADLPPGAVLKYRQANLWEKYRWQIVTVFFLLVLQGSLIVALLMQRAVRRRAELALSESEQRMSLAAAATGLGMWVVDIVRDEFWASPQLRRLLAVGESEVFDLQRFIAATHADDREALRQAIERATNDGLDCDLEQRIVLSAAEVRWAATRGRVERDRAGQPVRIRGVTVDVSARKEAEFDRQRQRNELSRLSRVNMLGQLPGSLAHELNQPLTAILSNAQAALRFLGSAAPDLDEVRDILVDIVADDERAGEVIRRLRNLFERGEAKRERLDLNAVVVEVLGFLRSDLVIRHVTVSSELFAQLPVVLADRVQLQQVLMNLILNGCEAMRNDLATGRRLAVRTACTEAREVVVSVADCGKGVAADHLESIFEPFFTTKETGIGLGLAISRSIILAHGGRLWASSDGERGTTLSFALPAEAPPAPSVHVTVAPTTHQSPFSPVREKGRG